MAMWVSGRVYPGKWRCWSPNMEVRFRWFSCPVQILLNFVGGKNPTNRNTMRWRFYNQSLGLDFSPLDWKYDNLLRFRCPAHVYSPGYKKKLPIQLWRYPKDAIKCCWNRNLSQWNSYHRPHSSWVPGSQHYLAVSTYSAKGPWKKSLNFNMFHFPNYYTYIYI